MNSLDLYSYEKSYFKQGYKLIAGCDEAGRGPMAGPLVVGLVILDPDYKIEGLNDSKKLSPKKRDILYDEIKKHSIESIVIVIEHDEVDSLNVYEASRQGMLRAIKKCKNKPDFILTDAMPLDDSIKHEAIIKGDAKSASIAAASIIAKVTRDRLMMELSKKYPEYGFEKHKGYVTKYHMEMIKKYGVCEEHRRSFAPVSNIINNSK